MHTKKIPLFLLRYVIFLSFTLSLDAQTLAIFGSSVANGTGDMEGTGGYAGRIAKLMEAKGWKVVNVSKGGDNTTKITPRIHKDLFPTKPDYVILGLSLGNEGIRSNDPIEQARVFEKYRAGVLRLIDSIQVAGAKPIIMNCYAHGWFSLDHYRHTQEMNKWINQLPYPSVNVLGALDNGAGNWPEGYENDPWHPNAAGHAEMYLAFVPSLLEAMAAGKVTPKRALGDDYTTLKNKAKGLAPVVLDIDQTMHSFSTSFEFKDASDGVLLSIIGDQSNVHLSVKEGTLSYQSSNAARPATVAYDAKVWNCLTIAHRYATKETLLFLNGQQIARLREQISPQQIILGGDEQLDRANSVGTVDVRHWTVHRSALNAEEAKALYYHQFIQSSLEVYIPFGQSLQNEAQSLTKVKINQASLSLSVEK
ncbi:MAG: SGNH/GDSL hydrolase family protein [Saprospiraceae bacterium]